MPQAGAHQKDALVYEVFLALSLFLIVGLTCGLPCLLKGGPTSFQNREVFLSLSARRPQPFTSRVRFLGNCNPLIVKGKGTTASL